MKQLVTIVGLLFLMGCATTEDLPPPSETPPEGQACGGIAGLPCGEDEYCAYEAGTCGAADQMGICKPMKHMCTREYLSLIHI